MAEDKIHQPFVRAVHLNWLPQLLGGHWPVLFFLYQQCLIFLFFLLTIPEARHSPFSAYTFLFWFQAKVLEKQVSLLCVKKKSSLAASSDLLILVYLGRVQPKDLWRRRIVGPKAKDSLFQIPCGVVQTVARFGDPLSSEFSGVSLLWLALLFSRFLLSFLVPGLFFCVYFLYTLGAPPFFGTS